MTKRLKILAITAMALGITSQAILTQAVLAADIIPEKSVALAADTAYPSDVSNVKAVGGDALIHLSWDAATDNVGVKGYKIFYGNTSVSSASGSYTQGPVDAGNVLNFDVKPLENGKTFYFAVTAYDAAGNESEFYSTEVSATVGSASVVDTVAPKVVAATPKSKNSVSVKFSEAVKLPLTKPESAFSVKEDLVNVALNVSKAVLDSADSSGKTVVLTTADQKKGSKYILTAGIQVQDSSGNPIVSGTSDTAVFTGTDTVVATTTPLKPAADPTTPAADIVAPSFVSVKALDNLTVEVTFSEPVVLLSNATENFIITDAADNTKIINVKKVVIAQDAKKVTLTSEQMAAQKYNLIALKVKDASGNVMPVENSATTFDGVANAPKSLEITKPITDLNPPITTPTKTAEAASDLMAKVLTKMIVNLSWKTNDAKMASVANFMLYMSTDRGATYGEGVVLGKDMKSYDFKNLQEDMVYYFKLTTKDLSGAESEGIVTFMTLPKTGPEIGLLFFGSAGLSAWLTKRKKKLLKK